MLLWVRPSRRRNLPYICASASSPHAISDVEPSPLKDDHARNHDHADDVRDCAHEPMVLRRPLRTDSFAPFRSQHTSCAWEPRLSPENRGAVNQGQQKGSPPQWVRPLPASPAGACSLVPLGHAHAPWPCWPIALGASCGDGSTPLDNTSMPGSTGPCINLPDSIQHTKRRVRKE